MNMSVLFVLLGMTWTAQAAALPSVLPAGVPKQDGDKNNNLRQPHDVPPAMDVATFISSGPTHDSLSDVADDVNIAEHLNDADAGHRTSFIPGYSVEREAVYPPDTLSRVKRAPSASKRDYRNKKRRHMMGGKLRPGSQYRE